MLGIPGFQREKNLLQRLGKKNIRKLIWTKQRVCVLSTTSAFSSELQCQFPRAVVRSSSEPLTSEGCLPHPSERVLVPGQSVAAVHSSQLSD